MIGFEDLVYLFNTPSDTRGICRLNFDEAAMLYKYVRLCLGDVVEIGRFDGGSSVIMAAASRGVVYSIDTHQRSDVKRNLLKLPFSYRRRIELIKGDSSTIGKTWPDPVSLVFIDGDHTLEGARKDVLAWKDHIPTFGYMILHDIRLCGDLRLDRDVKKFGLKKLLPLLEKEFYQIDHASTLIVLRKRT